MLNAVAEMHKATAERHWENICTLNQEIGGMQYTNEQLQAEVERLQKEVQRLTAENRQLRWEMPDE